MADVGGVKSARRTIELLETVARHPEGISFVDLSEQLGFPKSSLHGLLQTIVDSQWLTLDADSKRYSVGVRMWEAGQAFRRSRELTVRARRFLLEANEQLKETIQLGILDDVDVVYIDKVEGTRPLRLVSNVGSRLPAYVTGIGKVLLAGVDDATLAHRFGGAELERFTDRTLTSGDELLDVLQEVRVRGYAVDEGEYSPGVYCVAVPVIDRRGRTVAAMSCSVPQTRMDVGELTTEEIFHVLRAQAAGASEALGYRAAPDVKRTETTA